ncbi:hypothetical protein F7725_028078 [Dissostichus mawsoni]|uniref:Uncharacterized protein n=1 Tax=Dissostichus mawsoni TaxID=36200 RepID=A0A7J5XEZ8_DISMA|nr:hypothetical protein F7725_028078 [Dissostichus mawsoni]
MGFDKFSLLGWSDGGITAMMAAAKNPDLISRMVVECEDEAAHGGVVRSRSLRENLECLGGWDRTVCKKTRRY